MQTIYLHKKMMNQKQRGTHLPHAMWRVPYVILPTAIMDIHVGPLFYSHGDVLVIRRSRIHSQNHPIYTVHFGPQSSIPWAVHVLPLFPLIRAPKLNAVPTCERQPYLLLSGIHPPNPRAS